MIHLQRQDWTLDFQVDFRVSGKDVILQIS